MADISTRMSVSGLSQWRSSYQQAQQSVKTLDAELKRNEAQYKATGDKEKYLEDKTKLLRAQLDAQKKAASEAEKALKSMKDQGVDPASKSYQEFQRKLAEAQTAVLNTTVAMNNLDQSEQKASTGADKMAKSLGGIGKAVNLDAVVSGVNSIAKGLEDAAKAAIRFAREAWSEVVSVAEQADDIATNASILGMDVEDYQRYRKVFDTMADITVADWMAAKRKVQQAVNKPTAEQADVLAILGINTHEMRMGAHGWVEGAARPFEDVLWEIGQTLKDKVESGELTPDMADVYGEALFGKRYSTLKPLFDLGQEAFTKELEEQNVVSEEAIKNLAELNDELIKLQGDFETLKSELLGTLAPALKSVAELLDTLLTKLIEYLKSEDGQKLLKSMGDAVEGLFSDLSKIDPEEVVAGFAKVFDDIVGGLQWLEKNSGKVISAMEAILVGWGALKLSGTALDILKIVTGLQMLKGGGFNIPGTNGSNGDTTVVTDSTPKESKMPGILDKAVAGMATKAVLDTSFALIENASILADKTLSREEQLTQWVDAQVASGFIRPEDRDRVIAGNSVLFLAVPEVPEDAAENVSSQIGEVPVAVRPYVPGAYSAPPGDTHGGIGGGGPGSSTYYSMHANGLPWVPRDGYIAMLHRGERVMTAQENRNYTYNSNNYFGNVNLNNGMEIDALCDSIDRHNRRQHAGYGS